MVAVRIREQFISFKKRLFHIAIRSMFFWMYVQLRIAPDIPLNVSRSYLQSDQNSEEYQ
jgi:hypothetical protein